MIYGRLDRLITIQRKLTTKNSTGNESESYYDLINLWSSMRAYTGTEKTESSEIVASGFYVFKSRYSNNVKPKDRISYNGNYYDIVSVIELGRKDGLEITAKWKDNG